MEASRSVFICLSAVMLGRLWCCFPLHVGQLSVSVTWFSPQSSLLVRWQRQVGVTQLWASPLRKNTSPLCVHRFPYQSCNSVAFSHPFVGDRITEHEGRRHNESRVKARLFDQLLLIHDAFRRLIELWFSLKNALWHSCETRKMIWSAQKD